MSYLISSSPCACYNVTSVLRDCFTRAACLVWLLRLCYMIVPRLVSVCFDGTLGLRDCLRHDVCLFWLPRKYSFVFVSSLPPVCYDCYISVTWLSRAWCVFVVTVTTVLRDCPTLFWFLRWYSLFRLACASCFFQVLSWYYVIILLFLSVFYRFLSQHRKQKGF